MKVKGDTEMAATIQQSMVPISQQQQLNEMMMDANGSGSVAQNDSGSGTKSNDVDIHRDIPIVTDASVECPLCMENLDIDDLGFFPCSCGYQVCRFCWHRLKNDDNNGLCPACRQPYPDSPIHFSAISIERVEELKKMKKKQKEKQKLKETNKLQNLSTIRVVQKNLLFVIGISPRFTQEELRKEFSKYGKIIKMVINTGSAYVTYTRPEDAVAAIKSLNDSSQSHNSGNNGKSKGNGNSNGNSLSGIGGGSILTTVKASLGTTKYCTHWLRCQTCPKQPDCMYLHELADQEASFTKEEMQAGKHTEYEKRLIAHYLDVISEQHEREKERQMQLQQQTSSAKPQRQKYSNGGGGGGGSNLSPMTTTNNTNHQRKPWSVNYNNQHPDGGDSGNSCGGKGISSSEDASDQYTMVDHYDHYGNSKKDQIYEHNGDDNSDCSRPAQPPQNLDSSNMIEEHSWTNNGIILENSHASAAIKIHNHLNHSHLMTRNGGRGPGTQSSGSNPVGTDGGSSGSKASSSNGHNSDSSSGNSSLSSTPNHHHLVVEPSMFSQFSSSSLSGTSSFSCDENSASSSVSSTPDNIQQQAKQQQPPQSQQSQQPPNHHLSQNGQELDDEDDDLDFDPISFSHRGLEQLLQASGSNTCSMMMNNSNQNQGLGAAAMTINRDMQPPAPSHQHAAQVGGGGRGGPSASVFDFLDTYQSNASSILNHLAMMNLESSHKTDPSFMSSSPQQQQQHPSQVLNNVGGGFGCGASLGSRSSPSCQFPQMMFNNGGNNSALNQNLNLLSLMQQQSLENILQQQQSFDHQQQNMKNIGCFGGGGGGPGFNGFSSSSAGNGANPLAAKSQQWQQQQNSLRQLLPNVNIKFQGQNDFNSFGPTNGNFSPNANRQMQQNHAQQQFWQSSATNATNSSNSNGTSGVSLTPHQQQQLLHHQKMQQLFQMQQQQHRTGSNSLNPFILGQMFSSQQQQAPQTVGPQTSPYSMRQQPPPGFSAIDSPRL